VRLTSVERVIDKQFSGNQGNLGPLGHVDFSTTLSSTVKTSSVAEQIAGDSASAMAGNNQSRSEEEKNPSHPTGENDQAVNGKVEGNASESDYQGISTQVVDSTAVEVTTVTSAMTKIGEGDADQSKPGET